MIFKSKELEVKVIVNKFLFTLVVLVRYYEFGLYIIDFYVWVLETGKVGIKNLFIVVGKGWFFV